MAVFRIRSKAKYGCDRESEYTTLLRHVWEDVRRSTKDPSVLKKRERSAQHELKMNSGDQLSLGPIRRQQLVASLLCFVSNVVLVKVRVKGEHQTWTCK